MNSAIQIIEDNSGGITIQNPLTKAVAHFDDKHAARTDLVAILNGDDMSSWDTSDPECYISDEEIRKHTPNGGLRILSEADLKEAILTASLESALRTIEGLAAAMSNAKDWVMANDKSNNFYCHVLSYDVEKICGEIEAGAPEAAPNALKTIETLTKAIDLVRGWVITESGREHPLINILSYDVKEVCDELKAAIEIK